MKISVIIPCRNEKRHIREFLDSLLAQSYPNLEYMVIDGGSQDQTVDILKVF